MRDGMGRRKFLKLTAASTLAAVARQATADGPAAGEPPAPSPGAPAVVRSRGPVVVVASANGHRFKDGGPRTCVEEAYLRLARGEDVLEALVEGVGIVERDPLDDSVGFGGLPDADGVVQLDASVMHGPTRRAGAVAALEGVRTPAKVALAVMKETDHHLLVGAGAQAFARQLGFRIEDDLNTEHSRQLWLEWKRRVDPGHWLDPAQRTEAGERARRALVAEGKVDADKIWGTIHCSGLGAGGELAGVTTTSGLAWKIPGRVGDSPILGAGNWVDGEVGAAGSTGRGEANLFGLSSFLIVEELRRGRHPKDAALEACRRIVASTVERRLRLADGRPAFNVKFYVLDRQGRHAGVSLWSSAGGAQALYAVCTGGGPALLPMDSLLGEQPKG